MTDDNVAPFQGTVSDCYESLLRDKSQQQIVANIAGNCIQFGWLSFTRGKFFRRASSLTSHIPFSYLIVQFFAISWNIPVDNVDFNNRVEFHPLSPIRFPVETFYRTHKPALKS